MATRNASVIVALACSLFTLRAATLFWTAAENRDWNTAATNWGSARPNYVEGDTVYFRDAGAGDVFIGSNGLPMNVAPTSTLFSVTNSFQNGYSISGGDIVSGAMTVYGTAVYFKGYSNSLSFPGGLDIFYDDGGVSFDLSRFTNGASVHVGTGPISLNFGGLLRFATSNSGVYTFENDLGGFGAVAFPQNNHASVRFTGTLNLKGPWLDFSAMSSSGPWTVANELAGPVIINQNGSGQRSLNMTSWSKPLRISGVISDGPGNGTNALRFYTYYGGIMLEASNTYAHGTHIQSAGAPAGPVMVLPGATLGTGDVDASLGALILTDAGNISRSATLKWGNQITVTNRAKIRVASAYRNGPLPDGIYTANSLQGIQGDGSIRTPGTNLPPSLIVTSPTNGAALRDDEIVRFRVTPADVDSFIDRVEFYLDGINMRVRTNAPFSVSFTNVGVGAHVLHAVVFDDDGGSTASSPVFFHVRTRLTPAMSSNGLVLEFPAAAQTSYTLQMTPDFSPPAWSNVMSFGPGPERIIHYTNHLVPPPPASFYRVISP